MNVQVLRDRISELEEENRQLRDALAPEKIAVPMCIKLTQVERAVFRAIFSVSPRIAPRERIQMAAYGFGDRHEHFVGVYVYHLRQKLKPYGVKITNHRAEGYSIDAESAAIVRRLIEGGEG